MQYISTILKQKFHGCVRRTSPARQQPLASLGRSTVAPHRFSRNNATTSRIRTTKTQYPNTHVSLPILSPLSEFVFSSSHSMSQPHEDKHQRTDGGHDAGADAERQDARDPAHHDGRTDVGGCRHKPPPPSPSCHIGVLP